MYWNWWFAHDLILVAPVSRCPIKYLKHESDLEHQEKMSTRKAKTGRGCWLYKSPVGWWFSAKKTACLFEKHLCYLIATEAKAQTRRILSDYGLFIIIALKKHNVPSLSCGAYVMCDSSWPFTLQQHILMMEMCRLQLVFFAHLDNI